jgi:processive 1,2-diacylglycerol beta-glucosyltransferase
MADKKKIFMPIMEIGAGHKAPANSVKDAIESLYPGQFQIDIVDFGKESGALKEDQDLKSGWDYILGHTFLGKVGYVIIEMFRLYPDRYVNFILRDFKKKGMEYIKNYKPDIVFSPHFFCTSIAAMARDKFNMPFKVIGYDTDPFDGYTWWVNRKADIVMTASIEAKTKMIHRGMPKDRILVYPFPINNKFLQVGRSREEIQKQYGIDPSKKTMLSSAGGQGIGKNTLYAKELVKRNYPLNIILVCGKNEKLKAEMEQFKKDNPSQANLIPLGFSTNMNELHLAADMTVGKAGASATYETLLMKKPVIFTDWASYNEKPNLDYCVRNHLGWHAKNLKGFMTIIDSIMNSSILEKYVANIEKLGLKSGANDIAKFVVDNLK